MRKTLPCASGIREANKTKTRPENGDSIFTTGFRKLCENGLVVLHSSEKLWGWLNDGVNHELTCDIWSKFKLVPYLSTPAPRSYHLLIITDCYNLSGSLYCGWGWDFHCLWRRNLKMHIRCNSAVNFFWVVKLPRVHDAQVGKFNHE